MVTLNFVVKQQRRARKKGNLPAEAYVYEDGSSSTGAVRLSADYFRRIERELTSSGGHKTSTQRTYRSAYLEFTKFNLSLDHMPELLDDQLAIFVASRVQKGDYSSTVESYLSGISSYLKLDGIQINTRTARLRSLIKACKLRNDRVVQRMPIKEGLLVRVVRQVDLMFETQPYLASLYKCMLVMGYFGMMRVGEMAKGDHPVLARDVHLSHRLKKVQVILCTSKTHGLGDQPQYIKFDTHDSRARLYNRHFCPFEVVKNYLEIRGPKLNDADLLFVFADNSPVKPYQLSAILKRALKRLGIDPKDFGTHSLRIGHATQLDHRHVGLDVIRRRGRWRSNIIYRYICMIK